LVRGDAPDLLPERADLLRPADPAPDLRQTGREPPSGRVLGPRPGRSPAPGAVQPDRRSDLSEDSMNSAGSQRPSSEGPRMNQPSVLIVADVEANLTALEATLARLPCQTVRAQSGNQALKLLLKQPFAVMLLDVQMPDMDGYEVARWARQNSATANVPII